MGNQMVVVEQNDSLVLRDMMATAFNFAKASKSKNTKKTYAAGWASFINWCEKNGARYKETQEKEGLIALYASDMAIKGLLKIASLSCYITGICSEYKALGIVVNLKHPVLEDVLKGIRNTLLKRPARKEPILTEDLLGMMPAIPIAQNGKARLIGIRDRALILVGFTGAFRRSEFAVLTIEDLTETRDGYVALVRKSKTDQEGEGLEKTIPYGANSITCPVRAIKDWLDTSHITEGPVFREINRHGQLATKPLTGHSISRIIKRNSYLKGKQNQYGGHSLRAGFVTQSKMNGTDDALIMAQTGHKHRDTLDIYDRRGNSIKESAASMLGL